MSFQIGEGLACRAAFFTLFESQSRDSGLRRHERGSFEPPLGVSAGTASAALPARVLLVKKMLMKQKMFLFHRRMVGNPLSNSGELRCCRPMGREE